MIRLGLRLTLGGGREAAARLVVTAIAVALGVGMLLGALACLNALPRWLDWLPHLQVEPPEAAPSFEDPVTVA